MGVLHSHPSSEHTAVRSAKRDDSSALGGDSLGAERPDKLLVVLHHLLDTQESKVLFAREALISKRHRFSVVSMLSKHDSRAEILSESCGHEARVVVECPNVTLVSSIEKDCSLAFIVVLGVYQVSHLVCVSI